MRMQRVTQPTRAQVEEHNATHLPFRSWCPFCVSGRRDGPAHHRSPELPDGAEIGLDYCYIRRKGEESCVTILLFKERGTRVLRAWALSAKGVSTEEPAKLAVDGIRDLGLGSQRAFIKVDNERPLISLRDEVIRQSQAALLPVEIPTYDHQANGSTENGVKLFKGVLRVHLMALEDRLGGRIPSHHPISHMASPTRGKYCDQIFGRSRRRNSIRAAV